MQNAKVIGPDREAFDALLMTAGLAHGLRLRSQQGGVDDDDADCRFSYSCSIRDEGDGWDATVYRDRQESEVTMSGSRVDRAFDERGWPTTNLQAAVERMISLLLPVRAREAAIIAAGESIFSPPAWSVSADSIMTSVMDGAGMDRDHFTRRLYIEEKPSLRRMITHRMDPNRSVKFDMTISRGHINGDISVWERGRRSVERTLFLRAKPKGQTLVGISGIEAPATMISTMTGMRLKDVVRSPFLEGCGDRCIRQAGQDPGGLLTVALKTDRIWLEEAPAGIDCEWRKS